MKTIYKYVGPGVGIPGLPHEITKAQAKDAGVLEILEAAIANKSYVLAKERKSKPINPK